jgi:hypothetical protein
VIRLRPPQSSGVNRPMDGNKILRNVLIQIPFVRPIGLPIVLVDIIIEYINSKYLCIVGERVSNDTKSLSEEKVVTINRQMLVIQPGLLNDHFQEFDLDTNENLCPHELISLHKFNCYPDTPILIYEKDDQKWSTVLEYQKQQQQQKQQHSKGVLERLEMRLHSNDRIEYYSHVFHCFAIGFVDSDDGSKNTYQTTYRIRKRYENTHSMEVYVLQKCVNKSNHWIDGESFYSVTGVYLYGNSKLLFVNHQDMRYLFYDILSETFVRSQYYIPKHSEVTSIIRLPNSHDVLVFGVSVVPEFEADYNKTILVSRHINETSWIESKLTRVLQTLLPCARIMQVHLIDNIICILAQSTTKELLTLCLNISNDVTLHEDSEEYFEKSLPNWYALPPKPIEYKQSFVTRIESLPIC